MIAVIIIIAVLILWLVIQPKSVSFKNRGKIGEDKVSKVLNALPQEYHVINDVIIPDQKEISNKEYTTQIDHLVVSPFGIFVIETKNYSGWIFGAEKSKRWKETFKTTKGKYFYNPIKQNWGHTYALAEHLRLNIKLFKPIVVFSDDCELHVDTTTPVVYMSQLIGLILSYTQVIISENDVALILESIDKINHIGTEIENKHIQSIGERYIAKETTILEGKCPRCGGQLKLRNGEYGQFYGCSNYPQCRFTHDIRQ